MFLTKEKRHGDTPPMSLLCSKVDAIEWKSRTRGVFWAGGGLVWSHFGAVPGVDLHRRAGEHSRALDHLSERWGIGMEALPVLAA